MLKRGVLAVGWLIFKPLGFAVRGLRFAMRRNLLDFQADRIEMVLASHRVPSKVIGGTVTPRLVRFKLTPAWGTKLKRIEALSEEIALALSARSCRIFRSGGTINVELPRDDPKPVRLLPLSKRLSKVPPCTAILGLDEEGVPILLRISSPEVVHVLISGTTGCGKTELARAMVASLAIHNRPRDLQMVLLDPKGRGFSLFKDLPHLLLPPLGAEDALGALQFLLEEMEARDARRVSEPHIVAFIDELSDLILSGGAEMERAIARLSQRGRGAGIHLVCCIQKPTAKVLGGLIKFNFPVRIVGRVASPEDAKVASGIAGTGAEKLLGRGDFLLVAGGEVVRFQAAYISKREIEHLVARLRGGRPRLAARSIAQLAERLVR